jgi:hypothetical protein
LKTTVLAFPDARITFLAEEEHLRMVRSILSRDEPDYAAGTAQQPMAVPPREVGGWRRLRQELLWARPVLRMAAERKAPAVIVTSITNTGLLVLKRLLSRASGSVKVLVFPHSILTSLERPPIKDPWNWPISMRQALRRPHPPGFGYVALGPSIHRRIQQGFPRFARHFRPLDPPYLWANRNEALVRWSESPKVIRFGYIGVGYKGKGFDTFRSLASGNRGRHSHAEFVLVGFVPRMEKGRAMRDESWVHGLSREPLTEEEYRRRAASLTYAVMPLEPKKYRLSASASFLDALSFVKPGIYLRNDYVGDYFERMGDIGYLCDSPDEMGDVIASILAEFPMGRYRKQQENILRERRIFEPETLAPKLREIVEDL